MRDRITDIAYNGSDLIFNTSTGVKEYDSFVNMVILGIFGGNVEANEPTSRRSGDVIDSYWGNRHGNKENSNTERLLSSMTLSSSSPKIIENSIKNDLKYLETALIIQGVRVWIEDRDRINIEIYIARNKDDKTLMVSFVWGEDDDEDGNALPPDIISVGFDYVLDFGLA